MFNEREMIEIRVGYKGFFCRFWVFSYDIVEPIQDLLAIVTNEISLLIKNAKR